jgi:hypothetical protein
VTAGILMLAWPILLGVIGGAAAWWLWGKYEYFGYGVLAGVAIGILASGGTVAGSWLVSNVLAQPAPVVEAGPAQVVTTYAPLGSAQDIRIIPLASYDATIDNVRQRDLVWFVIRITRHGHSLRRHLGLRAPSGQIVDATYWRSLCKPLRKAGVIVGAESRKAGTLRTKDTQAILAQLGIDGSDSSLFLFNGAPLD